MNYSNRSTKGFPGMHNGLTRPNAAEFDQVDVIVILNQRTSSENFRTFDLQI